MRHLFKIHQDATTGSTLALLSAGINEHLWIFLKLGVPHFYVCPDRFLCRNQDSVPQFPKNIPGVTKVNEAPCMIGSRQPIRLWRNVARPAAKNIELTIFDLIT